MNLILRDKLLKQSIKSNNDYGNLVVVNQGQVKVNISG